MSNKTSTARRPERDELALETGYVEATAPTLTVRLGDEVFPARRAKSCLVAPGRGDRVACAIGADELFVLAVLAGEDAAETRLTVEGSLRVQAPSGRVSFAAAEGIDLLSAKDLALGSETLQVRAKRGSVAVQELGLLGRLVRAEVSKLSLVADDVDSRLERLMQRAKRVFRFVEEIEQVRAGTFDMRAEQLAAVRGENTIVSARVLAKIDGEQVHIG